LIGTAEYQWPVLHHGLISRVPVASVILAGAVALSLLLIAELPQLWKVKRGRVKVYLGLLVLGLAFQLGPAAVHPMGLLEYPLRIYLPDHTSYFTDAQKVQALRPWANAFPAHLGDFATHTRTHPPGAVALFYGAQRVAGFFPRLAEAYVELMPRSREAMQMFGLSPAQALAGGGCAMLLLLVSAAMAPLAFAVARTVITDQRAAMAAVLLASAPAFSHKTPILDHLFAGLILTALWLVLTAVRQRQMWRVALAGAIIGAGLWLGTSLLAAFPLIAMLGGAAIWQYRQDDSSPGRIMILLGCIVGALAGAAFLSMLAVGALLGADYLEVYQAITEIGWKYNNQISGRFQTWMWIAFNPYELLAWAGWPLAALFLAAVYTEPKKAWRLAPDHLAAGTIALAAFLLILDLSGKVCYEASRLCWFCYPLLAIPAAQVAPLPGPGRNYLRPALILGAQAVSTLVFKMIF
jgi:hypothetical protein